MGLIINGTRVYHTLSGNHDDDYFIQQNEMSESHWNLLISCHHQGQCDDDCEEASKYFEIADYGKAYDYLLSTGIDGDSLHSGDYDETAERDDHLVLKYYLWLLAGDIQERSEESIHE